LNDGIELGRTESSIGCVCASAIRAQG